MTPPTRPGAPTRSARARGALLGLAGGGGSLLRLATVLGEELLAPELDLGRTVSRWLELLDAPHDLPPAYATALQFLREHGAPPLPDAAHDGAAGVPVHVVPVALLTAEHPANLLSGAWHLAAITHPAADATWAAVALAVALARLLQGHRDFVADVTEALRTNEAPVALLDRVRRLPVTRRHELAPASLDAASGLEAALWLNWHEPRPLRGLAWLHAEGAPATTRAATGALYGALRGEAALASLATDAPVERAALALLADRLARVVHGH